MHQQTPAGVDESIDHAATELEQQTKAKHCISSTTCNGQPTPPTMHDRQASDDSNTEEDNGKPKYRRSPRYGRKWTVESGHVRVEWSICSDLIQIKATLCKYSPLPDIASCIVTYLGEGVGYKVFKISQAHTQPIVMRLARPLVDNGEKTRSERATHDFLCATIKEIRVPTIIASCDNALEKDNDVGVEWLLMTYLDGAELGCHWLKSKDLEVRKKVVKQIAKYHVLLYRCRFNQIGSLFQSEDAAHPQIGPLLARGWFHSPYKLREVGRGPYKNSYSWLLSSLESASDRIGKTKQAFFDDKELYYAEIAERCIPELKKILSTIFSEDDEEDMILFHTDTHANNFVVNYHNHLNGMLDWEYAFCAPLWLACQPPRFLAEGRTPLQSSMLGHDQFNMDDEGDRADFEYNKEGWENGKLLICFVLSVAKAEPGWARAFLDGGLKRSFKAVVRSLHSRGGLQYMKMWLRAWKHGRIMEHVPEPLWLEFHIPAEWEGGGLEKGMTLRDALEAIIARATMVEDASK